MIIERIQVEEGFLNGLNLQLSRGLNVLIGPRGAGKTSIIELVRFCLGSETLTVKAEKSSREHALSILGSGRVTVTLNDGRETFSISRSAEHWTKSQNLDYNPPVILSQNEIESVALHESGRLKLLDSISPFSPMISGAIGEDVLLSYIRSQSQERQSVLNELQVLRSQIQKLDDESKEAEPLKKQHNDALQNIEKAKPQVERLNELGALLASLSVRSSVYQRTSDALHQWRGRIQNLPARAEIEPWPTAASGEDPLAAVRELAKQAQSDIQSAVAKLDTALRELSITAGVNTNHILQYEEEARTIRQQIDLLHQGAGAIASKLATLQERAGQLSALKALEQVKRTRLQEIQITRKRYLDDLEIVRSKRFEERSKLVSALNTELGPRIRLSLERAGQTNEYASAIINALRGSGLRFNEVAPLIADQMSPREFVEAIESEDIDTLSTIVGIPPARAAKIIERINEQGVESILTASVEDGVELSLLDGSEYKSTEHLSTGQRCTVVLPILLKQKRLSLIVDQPEDHLDNAFVVDTLIKAILQRKADGQLIFSTHNANIPVLGEADQVVLLGSDGARGFVRHAAHLNDRKTVEAITNVMEGGIAAFDRRSKFYHEKI